MNDADLPLGMPASDYADYCRSITEYSPLPMATVEGPSRVVRYGNPAFCQLMDKPLEELVGKSFSELLPQKDACLALIERVWRTRRSESFLERDPAKPHPVFWSYTIWPLVTNESLVGIMIQVTETAEVHGQTVAMNEALVQASVRQHEMTAAAETLNTQLREEIAERKLVEEALRESESRFRILFESSPMAVFVCDKQGTIRHYNPRAVELWGGDSRFKSERSCESVELWHADSAPAHGTENPVRKVLRDGSPVRGLEMYIVREDGSHLPLLVSTTPMTDADGEVTGTITSCIDITGQKQAAALREQLLHNETMARLKVEEAGRMKDEFLATLSHELRTPLNAILGWAQLLRDDSPTAADLAHGLTRIEKSVMMQTSLIEDLLDMSRIVSGRLRLDLENISLSSVVAHAVETVLPSAEAKGIQFNWHVDPTVPPVIGDSTRLQQLLWNFCSNAIKFTPSGGKVDLVATFVDSIVEIRVTDTGQGIPADFLPFVFDRFRQADGSITRRHSGLGLGLSICKDIAALHGGTVRAETPGVGQGATFTFALPVATSSVTGSAPTGEEIELEAIDLTGLRILVVDNDESASEVLSLTLQKKGATVEVAYSGAAALALLEQNRFDLLVSDLGMPQMDGYELIRRVRDLQLPSRNMPAIAVTALAHPEDKVRALQAGYNIHLAKPVHSMDLLRAVGTLAWS